MSPKSSCGEIRNNRWMCVFVVHLGLKKRTIILSSPIIKKIWHLISMVWSFPFPEENGCRPISTALQCRDDPWHRSEYTRILVNVQKSVRKSLALWYKRRLSNRREQILHFDLSRKGREAITKDLNEGFLYSVCLYTFYINFSARWEKFWKIEWLFRNIHLRINIA